MSYSVNWSLKAKITFSQNLEYLSEQWDVAVVLEFIDRVDEVIAEISENPLLFPLFAPWIDVRKCILNERMVLFYKIVDPSTVDIITFWNTYQNPENLKI